MLFFGFEFIFSIFFILFLGVFIFTIVKNIGQWHKNNNSPLLTVPARISSKYTRTSHNASTHTFHTHYYITFEVESGDRMEFSVSSYEYGSLCEGDFGHLSFRGTRFLGFQRV